MLWQARTTETSIKAPKKFRNHYALAGADTGDKTIEQLEELQRKKEPFISGYLYKRMDLKYDPSMLKEEPRHFFMQMNDECTHDCLVHAVNFALRCQWFVQREQVIRLIQARGKITIEQAEKQKVKGGVSPMNFKNFAIVDGKSLSLKHLMDFKPQIGQDSAIPMMDFVVDAMLGPHAKYTELILLCDGKRLSGYIHACIFVRFDMKDGTSIIKMLDNKNHDELYYPTTPPLLPGQKLNIREDFILLYNSYQLYCINRETVTEKEAELINTRMMQVMTGKKAQQKEALVINADDTNMKRKFKKSKG